MSDATAQRKLKIEIAGLLALLALYLVLAVGHATLAPLTTGPDELAHYAYAGFIAEHGRLPVNNAERGQAGYKSDQPPLYHIIAAIPASLVSAEGAPFLKRDTDHPRRRLIERTRHAWGLYNTADEQWPYRGEVLRWHTGRWLSIIFGLATVLTTYFMARQWFAGQWLFALAAAAIVAFIPRFVLTGSMLNYETLVALVSALFLWLLLQIAYQGCRSQVAGLHGRRGAGAQLTPQYAIRNTQYAFSLGLLAGLAIVTKLSALILPLEILIAFWLIARFCGLGWKVWGQWLLMAAAGTLIPVGLWYGFVVTQFNTIAEDGLWTGTLRPLIAADSSDATTNRLLSFLTGGEAGFSGAAANLDSGPPWEWATTFFRSFWVVGIEGVLPLGTFGLVTALCLCAVAAAGLIVFWVETGRAQGRRGAGARRSQGAEGKDNTQYASHFNRLNLTLLVLHLGLPLVLPLIRYAVTFSLADTAQGRHALFLAAPALAILLVLGLATSAGQVTNYATRHQRYAGDTRHVIRNTQYTIRTPALTRQGSGASVPRHASHFIIFLPGVFLLFWSFTQLQTMTWAYLPPLPVTTQPERVPPIEQRLDAALSPYITLLGYQTQLDSTNRTLRVDLWWRAEAVSPVDYLWQLALMDGERTVQAEWQGHPADGRYPTRAWDPGDTIHDTIWLPVGGLAAGQYSLALHPQPTARHYPPQAEAEPVPLGPVTLPESTLQIFESGFSLPELGALAGYTVWKEGQPVNRSQPYRYRETVSVSLPPLPDTWSRQLQMMSETPAGPVAFNPVLLSATQAIFIVGPEWPGGNYWLQQTISDRQLNSNVANSAIIARITDRRQRDFTAPSPGQPLSANFADQVELPGYDLEAKRAEAGGGLPLTLYWRGLDWLGDDLTIFTKLLKTDDLSQHGGRDRLPREGYRTLYWAPGEVVTDPFGVPVDSDAPDGIYFINVGLYKTVDGQAISLPLAQDGNLTGATSINLGPVKIGATPPRFVQDSANPQVEVNQPFGDAPNLTLLGYNLDQGPESQSDNSPNPPNSLNLTLYWQVEAPLPLDYTTFVHLRSAAGETIAQKDSPPLGGAYPTSLWDPGEIIADEIVVPLPEELPAGGPYSIVIGLYDFNTGRRLAVPGNSDNSFTLTELEHLP